MELLVLGANDTTIVGTDANVFCRGIFTSFKSSYPILPRTLIPSLHKEASYTHFNEK